jgi:DNA-binding MurR/RpiR family transcriptional regulator
MNRELKAPEAELRGLLPQLRGHAARAARFMLGASDEIAVRSMREIAKQAGVAPVTLVRIAQRLGFDGFEEFRAAYVAALMARAGQNRGQAARMVSMAQMEGSLGFAAKCLEAELEIQRQTLANLTGRQLDAAVKDILAADRIFVAGRRALHAPAFSFAYSLRKIKPNTQLVDVGGGMSVELDGLGAGDLFVGFSTHPYSRVTLALAEAARAQRARIIAVTDSADSPLARIAQHVFVTLVHGYSFPESLSGVNAIGNILMGLAVSQMGQQALDRIEANEAQMRRSGEMMM